MREILVSVNLVIFKEPPDLIMKAVESVVRQTYRFLELNILDNSPKEKERDKLLQTIRKLIGEFSRIGFLYTPSEKNTGFAKAHNILIEKSKGDFIVFLNADARLHLCYVERALRIFYGDDRIAAIQPKIYRG